MEVCPPLHYYEKVNAFILKNLHLNFYFFEVTHLLSSDYGSYHQLMVALCPLVNSWGDFFYAYTIGKYVDILKLRNWFSRDKLIIQLHKIRRLFMSTRLATSLMLIQFQGN